MDLRADTGFPFPGPMYCKADSKSLTAFKIRAFESFSSSLGVRSLAATGGGARAAAWLAAGSGLRVA